jgi:hypothetical protein
MLLQQIPNQRAITDIALHKHVPITFRRHRIQISGIRQPIQIDDPHIAAINCPPHKTAANEPGTAGDQ